MENRLLVSRDIVAPLFTSLNGANEALDSMIIASETSSSNPLLSLSASGHTSDYYTDIQSSPQTCNDSQTYGNEEIPLINEIPAVDDDYLVCVKLIDAAGNITYETSSSITRDASPPVFTSLNLSNEAIGGINDSEKLANNPAFTLSASGYTADDYTGLLATSVTCDENQTYSNSDIPLVSAITPDGSYAVCVKLSDANSNITYGKSQTVVRDIAAPSFTL